MNIRLYRIWWRFTDELSKGASLPFWLAFLLTAMFGVPHILAGAA